jgi:hypothetical protein
MRVLTIVVSKLPWPNYQIIVLINIHGVFDVSPNGQKTVRKYYSNVQRIDTSINWTQMMLQAPSFHNSRSH